MVLAKGLPLRLRSAFQSHACVVRLASSQSHSTPDSIDKTEYHPVGYKPGTSTYAYDNPWPKLNGGRFDFLFGDGWRRPLAKEQGQWKRPEWNSFGYNTHDEYADWLFVHRWLLMMFSGVLVTYGMHRVLSQPDWPVGRNWARREAFLEIERRQKAGLPIISPDLLPRDRVALCLPSDEELTDFQVMI